MSDAALSKGTMTQVAFVVKDIEKASKLWAEALGMPVPKWNITDTAAVAHTLYKGKPTEARAKLAFFNLGQVTIELIEPVGDPSTWADGLKAGGVHHIAFNVADADASVAELAKQGMKVIQKGDFTGGCYIYIDAAAQLGTTLELLAKRP